jgi:hypothetical protein
VWACKSLTGISPVAKVCESVTYSGSPRRVITKQALLYMDDEKELDDEVVTDDKEEEADDLLDDGDGDDPEEDAEDDEMDGFGVAKDEQGL